MKNSLLGWVKSSTETPDDLDTEWSCSACTLLNPASRTSCSVCQTPRDTTVSTSASASGSDMEDVICIEDGANNIVVGGKGVKRQLEEASSQPAKKTFKFKSAGKSSPNLTTSQNTVGNHINGINTMKSQTGTVGTPKGDNSKSKPPSGMTGTTPTTRSSNSGSQKQGNNGTEGVLCKIPVCPTHKKRCNMKEVRKEGTNKGRWFFSCPLRTCNYFEVSCFPLLHSKSKKDLVNYSTV